MSPDGITINLADLQDLAHQFATECPCPESVAPDNSGQDCPSEVCDRLDKGVSECCPPCKPTTATLAVVAKVYSLPSITLFERCNNSSCGCQHDLPSRYCPIECCRPTGCESFQINVCGRYCLDDMKVALLLTKSNCKTPIVCRPETKSNFSGCISFVFPDGLSAGWWKAQLVIEGTEFRKVSNIDRFKLEECLSAFDCLGDPTNVKL